MMHETIAAPRFALNLRAERQPLLDALDFMARRLVEARHTVPILSNVRLEAIDGALVISGCDLDIEAALIVPADVQAPGVATVNASALRDIVKAAAKGACVGIRVRSDTPERLETDAGRAANTLPTLADRDMPHIRTVQPHTAFELPRAQLASDLARVAPFISTDENRYWLNGALVELHPGGMAIVATDGSNLSVAQRPTPAGAGEALRVTLPRKLVDLLARAIKAFPGDTVRLGFSSRGGLGDRCLVESDRFAFAAKVIDGDFPDWRAMSALALGDELQAVIDPEGEPRLHVDALKAFDKAAGPLRVEMGSRAARLSIAGDDSWHGVTGLAAEGTAPKGYQYLHNGGGAARAYLEDLMQRHGIEAGSAERSMVVVNGRVLGMTVGTYEHERKVRFETVLDWEALVDREIEIVEHEAGWQPGAYSVVMPRVNEAVATDIWAEADGVRMPIATNARGSVHLTAGQVAKLCGPVDPSMHVAIAPLPVRKAWWKKAAPALAPAAPAGRDALHLSADAMRDHSAACQRAADAANSVAVAGPETVWAPVEPVAVLEPAELPEPVAAAPPPVQAPPVSELDELRAMVLAMADRLAAVESRGPAADAAPGDIVMVEPVAIANAAPTRARRDDVARLKLVRTYLALRQARAALARAAVQHAIGQRQYDDVNARLAMTSEALEITTERLEQVQADARRYVATEQALIDARSRGDRMARVAMRQRTGLARAAIDLRGARAETGAVRRQLAQALQPAPAPAAPSGTMAVAFARAVT